MVDGGRHAATTKVTGIGKYPYIRLSENEVDFGEVIVGHTVEYEVRVVNQSIVGVSYSVERATAEHDHVYRVGPAKGHLPAGPHPSVGPTLFTHSAPLHTRGILHSTRFLLRLLLLLILLLLFL